MRFNRDNPNWFYNEDQYLKDEDHYKLIDDYNTMRKEMLHADVLEFADKMNGVKRSEYEEPEEVEQRKRKLIIGTVIGSLVFISLAVCLLLRQLVISGYIACFIFAFAGISVIVTGKANALESTSKALKNRIMGFSMTLASVLIALLIFFRGSFNSEVFFVLLFVITFGITGLTLLLCSALRAFAGKMIYTQDVSATCVGFVRTVTTDQSDNSHMSYTYICTSPLFKYAYEGNQYDAVYDDFVTGKNSDIALDQTVTIRIDPRHPENIKSPEMTKPAGMAFLIIMGVAFTVVAIGLGVFLVGGNAKGLTLETQWNTGIPPINVETVSTESLSKIQVTDKMIEEYYRDKIAPGKDWYFEIATIASREKTVDGIVVKFSDNTFRSFISYDENLYEPGTQLLCYYIIDEERLELGYGYKTLLATGEPDMFEYVGSHTAYEGK